MQELLQLLEQTSQRHSHLCPRQVLGVRMALAGARQLGVELPRGDKELLVISETDGCFLDGLEVATGLTPGHRTLRIEDYGKIAATFIVVKTGFALRLAPRQGVRHSASLYAPGETRHYFAQLQGYQVMPEDELFTTSVVTLTPSAADIISRAGVRTDCTQCGEEIINEREVMIAGKPYCQSCCGRAYYAIEAVSEPLYKRDKVLTI